MKTPRIVERIQWQKFEEGQAYFINPRKSLVKLSMRTSECDKNIIVIGEMKFSISRSVPANLFNSLSRDEVVFPIKSEFLHILYGEVAAELNVIEDMVCTLQGGNLKNVIEKINDLTETLLTVREQVGE